MDRKLQRRMTNSFAFLMGGKIVVSEFEQALCEEMAHNRVVGAGGTEVPNVFRAQVSPKDFANLVSVNPGLAGNCADMLSRLARNEGWSRAGAVVVSIVESPKLRTGQLNCESHTDPAPAAASAFIDADGTVVGGTAVTPPQRDHRQVPSVPGRPAVPEAPLDGGAATYRGGRLYPADPAAGPAGLAGGHPAQPGHTGGGMPAPASPTGAYPPEPVRHAPTVTLLLQDGSSRTYLVMEGANIIGRASDVDFRLPDTGVSRRHAEITWDGRDAVLVDLHSRNGTMVNNIPVDNWQLADGDVITIGHSYIEVRITGETGM
ncbi:DUF3662 domain-containing protein [Corynebacterium sp. CCM 8862]|uniref:DUF3662 domain-containing protein n=2 Tax=Corynebacterium mendelii TaxID=2765362 RepID=A0A939DZW3_9CORY|nr:DUF3662 and FHA domain-containing protein [Corynebacterium mendelii]MBN9644335.1 DUF3662 domain-containing protein [Corynebacterium mendelii]